MPYITTERVKEIRTQIKKEFPKFKFSITKRHHSSVDVTILSGPIEMITKDFKNRNDGVNHFYIKENYESTPEIRDVLLHIYAIMNEGNGTESQDGDYGRIPNFYTGISIGQWNKPYEVTK